METFSRKHENQKHTRMSCLLCILLIYIGFLCKRLWVCGYSDGHLWCYLLKKKKSPFPGRCPPSIGQEKRRLSSALFPLHLPKAVTGSPQWAHEAGQALQSSGRICAPAPCCFWGSSAYFPFQQLWYLKLAWILRDTGFPKLADLFPLSFNQETWLREIQELKIISIVYMVYIVCHLYTNLLKIIYNHICILHTSLKVWYHPILQKE